MAFQVPSLSDVSRTIENGFSAAFYGKSGSLRVGVLKVLSKVIAGGCYLPILFCQYIFRNSFIDSADVENLVRFGGWYNLPHKVASPARGRIYVTFNKVSATIPSGAIIVDPNTNDEYEILDSVENNNSSSIVTKFANVVAVNVGSSGNRSVYQTTNLKLRDLDIEGVDFQTESIGGGASFDISVNGIVEQWGEDVESYRKRLKYRRQHQPMGGAVSDYKQWAEKFTQVTDAFVFGNFPSTNCVSVFCADYNSNISLNSDELSEVREYINSDSRKPLTACVHVASVDPIPVTLTIAVPSVAGSVRKNVVETLTKYFKGFGFGSTITKALIQKVLVENGVCSSCTVNQIKVNGEDKTNAGYEFKLNTISGSVHGEVFNTNRIDGLLTLVAEA